MTPQKKKIERLEDEILSLRMDIIRLMPEKTQDILLQFYSYSPNNDLKQLTMVIAEEIIKLADVKDPVEFGDYLSKSKRAYCPLCGAGSENTKGQKGYSVPEGLLKHLLGSHNSQQCCVFSAAQDLVCAPENSNLDTPT